MGAVVCTSTVETVPAYPGHALSKLQIKPLSIHDENGLSKVEAGRRQRFLAAIEADSSDVFRIQVDSMNSFDLVNPDDVASRYAKKVQMVLLENAFIMGLVRQLRSFGYTADVKVEDNGMYNRIQADFTVRPILQASPKRKFIPNIVQYVVLQCREGDMLYGIIQGIVADWTTRFHSFHFEIQREQLRARRATVLRPAPSARMWAPVVEEKSTDEDGSVDGDATSRLC